MPRLPTKNDLRQTGPLYVSRGLPSGDSGGALVAEGLARGMQQVQQGALVFEKHVNDREAADVEYRFQAFADDHRKAMMERQKNAPPGAEGFTDQTRAGYVQSADDFYKTISPRLRPEMRARMRVFEGQLTTAASQFQDKEGERFALGRGDDIAQRHLNAIGLGADPVTAIREYEAWVDREPSVTEKDKHKRTFRAAAGEAGARYKIESNPGDRERYATGGGFNVGNIRAKEGGFRTYATAEDAVAATVQNARAYPQAYNGGQPMPLWDSTIDPALGRQAWLKNQRGEVLTPAEREQVGKIGRTIAGRWAPYGDGQNDPAAWARNVAAAGGVPVDKPLDLGNPGVAAGFAKGTHVAEFGRASYAPDAYTKGAQQALAGQAPRSADGTGTATAPRGREVVVPDGVPYAGFVRLQQYAKHVDRERRADEARDYAGYKDTYELGVATGKVASPDQILNDPRLKDGDKASLLTSWQARNKKLIEGDDVVREFIARRDKSDSGVYNPHSEDDRKKADIIWERFGAKGGDVLTPTTSASAILKELMGAGSAIPKDVGARLRQGLDSKTPGEVEKAAALAAWLDVANPVGLAALSGGEDIRKAAEKYRAYVDSLGMSGAEAARRISEDKTPERRQTREAFRKDLESESGVLAKIDVSDVRRAIGQTSVGPVLSATVATMTGGLLGEHRATEGFTPRETTVAVSDYRALFRENFLDTGDPDRAKAKTDIQFGKLYGVSNVGGRPRLMKYPPERIYPPVDGSHGYIGEQAVADIKQATGKDVRVGDIILMADESTAREVRAGDAPAYRLLYVSRRDGQEVIERAPGDFRPDVATAAKVAQGKRETEFRPGQEQPRGASEARGTAIKGRQPGQPLPQTDAQRRELEAIAAEDERRRRAEAETLRQTPAQGAPGFLSP
jgi:hypothetical protein